MIIIIKPLYNFMYTEIKMLKEFPQLPKMRKHILLLYFLYYHLFNVGSEPLHTPTPEPGIESAIDKL